MNNPGVELIVEAYDGYWRKAPAVRVQENWPHLFDRDAILAMAERKMADLYDRGIRV